MVLHHPALPKCAAVCGEKKNTSKIHLFPLESWVLPRRKTPQWLSSLDVVFGITHPAFSELLTWGFNNDESSQISVCFEEK